VAAALGPAPCPPRLHAISAALSKLREAPRHPVVLVLDPEVQGLPWESLPSLRACRQAASRVPSLAFLHSLWRSHATSRASVINTGVSTDSVFYVVNPDGNLPDTQQRLDKAFQDFKRWEGVKGTEPSKDQLERVLQDKDAYMFCGHGSGSKFLSGDEVEKLRVHAVPVLLGCSSGQLARHGRSLDPIGTVQSFLVASSPAIVGFLWAVTDADVDQWTVTFLQHWLGGKKDGQAELLQACADKRSSFKQVLNGAALVVYGLPLRSQR
jgi:separase